MRKVIAYVAENAATEHGCRSVPIIEEDCVGELVKWCCEGDKEGWWHDKAVLVHRKVVVDAVKEEVTCDADPVVWQVSSRESAIVTAMIASSQLTYRHGTTLGEARTPPVSTGKGQSSSMPQSGRPTASHGTRGMFRTPQAAARLSV